MQIYAMLSYDAGFQREQIKLKLFYFYIGYWPILYLNLQINFSYKCTILESVHIFKLLEIIY